MEKLIINIEQPNNPFAIGVCSIFTIMLPCFKGSIKKNILTLSDKYECDVALMETDIERNPYSLAKVLFTRL